MNLNQFEKDEKARAESESNPQEMDENHSSAVATENRAATDVPLRSDEHGRETAVQGSQNGPVFHVIYAGFWMRFWAYLVDLLIIGSINRMIINPVFRALDVSLAEDGIFSSMTIATALVFYLYFVLMTKYFGQTLGKMVFGLKVVELSGRRLSWGTVIFREWIGRFISATVIVLYIVVAFTKRKQGLHDLFADTAVIIEPR